MRRYVEHKEDGATYIRARYATLAARKERQGVVVEECVRLQCVDEDNLEANSFYSLRHTELHSVVTPLRPAATLVLQGAHRLKATRVYAKSMDQLRGQFNMRYFSHDEIVDKLTRLRTMCMLMSTCSKSSCTRPSSNDSV